jgi:DNA-binding YbaB/EbfC family protein
MVNINKLMKQAQKLQEDMARKMESMKVEGTSGGGAVKIEMNGKKEVLSVSISKEAVDPADMTVLEDLVMAAANDALRKVEEELAGSMPAFPPGFPLG